MGRGLVVAGENSVGWRVTRGDAGGVREKAQWLYDFLHGPSQGTQTLANSQGSVLALLDPLRIVQLLIS